MIAAGTGRRRESALFTLVVTVLCLCGGLVVAALLVLMDAPAEVALATLLALLPVGPLVGCFLWLDRYEPEPRRLLASAVAWGACVATSLALVPQLLLSQGLSEMTQLAVVAPVTEEATKGFFLLLLLWWRRAELDGVLDGVVYAGMVGIGFAFTENILYLSGVGIDAELLGESSSAAVTWTFVVRCIASPFAHPLFTAAIGVGVGLAVGARSRWGRVLAPFLGYCAAVLVHGLWNGSVAFADGSGFVIVYLVLMAPLLMVTVGFAVWLRSSERQVLTAALSDAARRGLLPATDIGWIVDLRARRVARIHAERMGGRAALRAMEEYQQAAVELGFLHHRYLRGTPPPDFATRGQSFVVRLNAVRPLISFPGQVVPTR